jgi:hypothetical protein
MPLAETLRGAPIRMRTGKRRSATVIISRGLPGIPRYIPLLFGDTMPRPLVRSSDFRSVADQGGPLSPGPSLQRPYTFSYSGMLSFIVVER